MGASFGLHIHRTVEAALLHARAPAAIGLILLCGAAQAQDDYVADPVPPAPWGSAYLASGSSTAERRELVMADYRTLLAGTAFIQADLTGYRQQQGWSLVDETTSTLVFGAGFHPFQGIVGKGPELRVGFSHGSGGSAQLELERSDRFTLDTLISSTTGTVFIVDSMYTDRYTLQYRADRFGLDASLVFRTDQMARWSLFGGGGLGFGGRFNAHTSVTRTGESSTNRPGGPGRSETELVSYEEADNSGGSWLMFYAPVGVGFRIAKQGDLWGRMELYLEGRPGMMVQGTKEFGTTTSFGSQVLFGLRVRLG